MSERGPGPGRPARQKDGTSRPAASRTGSVGRQGLAAWRVERVQKEDGRYLLYYSWPHAAPKPRKGDADDV